MAVSLRPPYSFAATLNIVLSRLWNILFLAVKSSHCWINGFGVR